MEEPAKPAHHAQTAVLAGGATAPARPGRLVKKPPLVLTHHVGGQRPDIGQLDLVEEAPEPLQHAARRGPRPRRVIEDFKLLAVTLHPQRQALIFHRPPSCDAAARWPLPRWRGS